MQRIDSQGATPIYAVPWNEKVFDVNQLFFALLQYLEFPACLALSSVHSTWCTRLWPYTTSRLAAASDVGDHTATPGRKRKRAIRRERMQRIRQAMEAFEPDASRQTQSVVSAHASYGQCVTHAVFHTYPERAYHHRQMCKQLCFTYCNVQHLTLHVPYCARTLRSIFCMEDYETIDRPATTAWRKRMHELCAEWHSSIRTGASDDSTLTLHAPCLKYLDACVQGNPLRSLCYIQSMPLHDLPPFWLRPLYGTLLTKVRNVTVNLEKLVDCDSSIVSDLWKALGPSNGESRVEVLEICTGKCEMVYGEVWDLCLARNFPSLKRLVLQCTSVDTSYWPQPPLRIYECTAQFQQLTLSSDIVVDPASTQMLLENGVFITRT